MDWLDWIGLPFPFQSYRVNANQLRQAEAVLVVSTQLGGARTPLPGSLKHYAYPVIIIVSCCYFEFPLLKAAMVFQGIFFINNFCSKLFSNFPFVLQNIKTLKYFNL